MLSCLLAWLKTNKNNIGTSFFSHLQPLLLEINRFISTFACNSLIKDQIFLRLYENSNDILSSHVRNFYVGSYENSLSSFILFLTKKSCMWLPLRIIYLKIYEHSHALTKNCFRTKNFVCKESFVRHRRKKLLNLRQWPGVQTTWKIYKMENVLKGAP